VSARTVVPVILDTDIGPDCDDAGAVAVLNALADRGEAEILAMACCVSSPWGAPCLDAINTYYGRPDVPIGTYKKPGFLLDSSYSEAIAREFPNRLQRGENAPDARELYRKTLARQPDGSATICAIGPLNNLGDLLDTAPDEWSALGGVELVARKVRRLVVMGCAFPAGPSWNQEQDGEASARVAEQWPTRITFSGREIGLVIQTGARLYTETPTCNPVRRAYELYTGGANRPSWDQTAVLYGVRGARDYWTVRANGQCRINEDGTNQWHDTPDRGHSYLVEKMPVGRLGGLIEDLMVQAPRHRAQEGR